MALRELFTGESLSSALSRLLGEAARAVDDLGPAVLLHEPHLLAAEIIDRFQVQPVVLHVAEDEIMISDPVDMSQVVQDVRGPRRVEHAEMLVFVPFDGDRRLFTWAPDPSPMKGGGGPAGDFDKNGNLILRIALVPGNADASTEAVRAAISGVEKYLAHTTGPVADYADRLAATVNMAILHHGGKHQRQIDTVAGMPFKVRRRGDALPPKYPVKRRILAARSPVKASAKNVPSDPFLDDGEFDGIVQTIQYAGWQMERSPTATLRHDENGRRDWMLVALNAVYQDAAAGEAFSRRGHSDILLQVGPGNVFIAECKIWNGPAKLVEAIDQLFNYVTWRDTKASLIVFFDEHPTAFSALIDKAIETLAADARCLHKLPSNDRLRRQDFRYRHDDPGRHLRLAFLPFVIDADPAERVDP